MRNSRIDAGLIEECARDHQVTPRSVRTWRLNEDRRWREWLQKRAGQQSRLPSLDFVTEAAGKITPEDEEAQALRRYLALTELCDSAIARGDQVSVVPLLRSAEQAHRTLQVVRENRLAYGEKTGRLLDRDDAMQFFLSKLSHIRDLMILMPGIMAHRIDPLNAPRIEMILSEEINRILFEADDMRKRAEEEYPDPSAEENSATFSATLRQSSPPLSET